MAKRDRRMDSYIAKAAPFAQPILQHLRDLVHAACPDVEEAMKWSSPHFLYKGMLCGMAAFKAHCVFGFWKGSLVVQGADKEREAMGQFGRITKLADLPSDRMIKSLVKRAMKLNEEGVATPRPLKHPKPPVVAPADLVAALKRNKKAQATYDAFSASHRRDYVEWITEAKRPETRKRRLASTIEWLAQGKAHNWKYAKR